MLLTCLHLFHRVYLRFDLLFTNDYNVWDINFISVVKLLIDFSEIGEQYSRNVVCSVIHLTTPSRVQKISHQNG